MLYLNKFLKTIKEDSKVLSSKNLILDFGLIMTQIKGLKKYAFENDLIEKTNQEYFLTQSGEEYLLKNPIEKWPVENKFNLDINVEYLKESKTPSSLTKAMRLIAKYLLEGQPLKGCSLESALYEDIKNCKNLALEIEKDVFNGKRTRPLVFRWW